jgi:hypothetical protein
LLKTEYLLIKMIWVVESKVLIDWGRLKIVRLLKTKTTNGGVLVVPRRECAVSLDGEGLVRGIARVWLVWFEVLSGLEG